MKFSVYAVTKNEVFSAKRFMTSINRAGLPAYILDHSTDGTTDILREMGAHVDTTPLEPWRFDHGKNAALALVPGDIDFCLNVDLDEEVSEVAKDALSLIDGAFTRVCHLYRPDGNSGRVREETRLHRRHGYTWKWPVHEELVYNGKEKIQFIDDVLLTQWPNKKRGHTWTDRLLDAIRLYPNSPRMRLFCGRDLYFDGRFTDALNQLSIFVRMRDAFSLDKAYAFSLISKCQRALGEDHILSLRMAVKAGKRREARVELAHAYLLQQNYKEALFYAREALEINRGMYCANSDPGAWSFKPHEIMMIAAYNLRQNDLAVQAGTNALQCATEAEDKLRITQNLSQMGALS